HLKAFSKAVKESLRWAFHHEDARMWTPKRRRRPRLEGFGKKTIVAAVSLDIKMTAQEKRENVRVCLKDARSEGSGCADGQGGQDEIEGGQVHAHSRVGAHDGA
ncbi:MAG: hypothetical protein ACKPKO_22885, partial [Candidatus Fonsibacter sp.]